MKHYAKILTASILLLSSLYADEAVKSDTVIETKKIVPDVNSDTMNQGLFTQFYLGASKITLDDTYHKALRLGSKTGYKFNKDFSIYIVGESNIYRHLGDVNDMGFSGIGFYYTIPYTSNKLSFSAAAGIGGNLNYNRLFNDFRKSFDFGFAYRANLDYSINEKWSVIASYSKFDLNTNATQLEDTKPEIISLSIGYKFDSIPLLKLIQ